MNILVIHQNFPGQFRHLCIHLSQRGDVALRAIGRRTAPGLPGIELLRYDLHREPTKGVHHYVTGFERAVLYGQAVARVLQRLKGEEFVPDVVLAHPGWGETLFVKDVFPSARLIHFCEFFYRAEGADADFDPSAPLQFDDRARITARNALHLLNLELCDAGVTPTSWQKQLHPVAYRHKIHLVHEGIDTENLGPLADATLDLPDGTCLRQGEEIVTYVARNLEPYRGFPSFMRALPAILAARPKARIVIVGGDEVSYSRRPKDATTWREKLLAELALTEAQLARIHFLGRVPYPVFCKLLQVSAAHVYLTYPFVLSWSMLEAMASGCLVIGSKTAPVEEVIEPGRNGLLVDFFDSAALAKTVCEVLEDPKRFDHLRAAAIETVRARFNLKGGLQGYLDLLGLPAGDSVSRQAEIAASSC
ncbi:MAG: glycosyltransferase family 4 protein [Betaproteobacteria bacterium]|nr:glycosyltransferase family 4 protein [Betaproteobacteria bacterium]